MKNEVGLRLKEIRLANKMTQADMAKLIKMAAGSVGALENGLYTPSFRVMKIIKRRLGVPYDYIIDGEKSDSEELIRLREENARLKRVVDRLTK